MTDKKEPDNMRYWNQCKKPPKDMLKEIEGGRLKGMTDIKPQWRYEVMTEMFGPCGDGWDYTIPEMWTIDGAEGQKFVFAKVMLCIKGWDVIPGIGGSMLIEKQKDGLYHNDEAYKMAVTDALGSAMKMIGVAADVYMGKEGASESKYRDTDKKTPSEPKKASQAQIDTIKKIYKDKGGNWEENQADLFKVIEKIVERRVVTLEDLLMKEAFKIISESKKWEEYIEGE